MKKLYVPIILLFSLTAFAQKIENEVLWCDRPVCNKPTKPLQRIAFGSCAHQNKEQPILKDIASLSPDLMIYLGDNIYGDSDDTTVLKKKYGYLSCKPEFRHLLTTTPTIAIWDDHDYGRNDAGIEYPLKAASKDIFLRFWNEPANSSRWNAHEGIYHALYYGDSATRVQIILLDTRTFRSPLIGRDGRYQPNYDTTATILGSQQWNWLTNELKKPARIRIICSSTQFCIEHNGWEGWPNFPLEQARMFTTIKQARANGVVFLSGDVHYAELSRQQPEGCYPIYDMTASGLTHRERKAAPNKYRIGHALIQKNFGLLDIKWDEDPTLIFRAFDWTKHERIIKQVKLSELTFN